MADGAFGGKGEAPKMAAVASRVDPRSRSQDAAPPLCPQRLWAVYSTPWRWQDPPGACLRRRGPGWRSCSGRARACRRGARPSGRFGLRRRSCGGGSGRRPRSLCAGLRRGEEGGGWERVLGESAGCPDVTPALDELVVPLLSPQGEKAEGRGEPRLPRPCPGQPAFPLMISHDGG